MFTMDLFDAWMTLIAGAGCCLYAWRPVMPGPRQAEWATWHRTAGRYLRIVGPLLALSGLVQILSHAAA